MVQYKNILIPVDGSEASIKAFKQAVHIAERNDAALYLVALDSCSMIRILYSMNWTGMREQMESQCIRKCALATQRK